MERFELEQALVAAAERVGLFQDRRERIATACLAGMLSRPDSRSITASVSAALESADVLIAALDKPADKPSGEPVADRAALACIATGFARRLPGSNRSVLEEMLRDVRTAMPSDPSEADVETQQLMVKALETIAGIEPSKGGA